MCAVRGQAKQACNDLAVLEAQMRDKEKAFFKAHPRAERIMTNRGRFICSVCGKSVGWRGGLGQHLRWHAVRGDIQVVTLPVVSFETIYILPNGESERH